MKQEGGGQHFYGNFLISLIHFLGFIGFLKILNIAEETKPFILKNCQIYH